MIAVLGEGLSELASLSILAVLQGLTEFLPVSSSGHLVFGQAVLSLDSPALSVDVALHVGTLLAVLLVYRADLAKLLRDARDGDLREPLLIVAGTVPAAVIGLLFREQIHGLFESVRAAAIGLCATAAILIVGEWSRRRAGAGSEEPRTTDARRGAIDLRTALIVGAAQALAILPGVSRSGTTIACGLLLGLTPHAAARFSFLLAIPTILGAAMLELPDVIEQGTGDIESLCLATALAAVVGYVALRALLAFLSRGAFAWFAAYCLALGVTVLALTGGSA